MPRRNIGHGWTIDLPDGFTARADDGRHQVYWSAGRTVYAVVYKAASGEAEAALAEMAADRGLRPLERLQRRDGTTTAEAWLTPEQDQRGNPYFGLNTYTASPGSVACVTFYFPTRSQLEWAVETWRTVCPPAASVRQN